ncbi:HSF-type DNA-binding protein [Nitzschia inconspicua]|uniref:HSF-type DNA-binding protein n=1 Tax=Nitzschia inconspicua TaxID=303405 RepID=A0A9K3LC24_9STRA|nr:HSF-type DNA-binding protein [Nitzschia inconspicua]
MNTQHQSDSLHLQKPAEDGACSEESQDEAMADVQSLHDHHPSPLDILVESEKLNRRRRDFPWKLHTMLEEVESSNQQQIVSWQLDGTCFRVFRPEEFVQQIMPHYFHQTQYRSFQRMLNLYEFQKISSGKYRGSYSHPMFNRNDRELCLQMRIRKRSRRKHSEGTLKKAIPTRRISSSKKMLKVVSTSTLGGPTLAPQQNHHLRQYLMARGGLVPRGSIDEFVLLSQHQKNLLRKGEEVDFSIHHNIAKSLETVQQTAGPMIGALETSGMPHLSNQIDPASLHRQQPFPQNVAAKGDGDYESQKIKISERSFVARQHHPGRVHILPMGWNASKSLPMVETERSIRQEDDRLHPSSTNISEGFSARLRVVEDRSAASAVAPMTAQNQPLFAASHQMASVVGTSPSPFVQAMPFIGAQQQQLQEMLQQQLQNHYHRQNENRDEMSLFHLPLSNDLEPNPFP